MTDGSYKVNEMVIKTLQLQLRSYDDVSKSLAKTKQRIGAFDLGKCESHTVHNQLEKAKKDLSAAIKKTLAYWPLWTEWMVDVPGIGPFIGGNLVMFYYYRWIPICKQKNCEGDLRQVETDKIHPETEKPITEFRCTTCGKKAKGEGVLSYRIEDKDFPNVSKWWAYMGRAVDPTTNRLYKRIKGYRKRDDFIEYNVKGRTIGFHFSEAVNKKKPREADYLSPGYRPLEKDHLYKLFLLEAKKKIRIKDVEKKKSDMCVQKQAGNKTIQLFLSHMWHVARTLDGKSTQGPWIQEIKGHSGIIPPYYWTEPIAEEKAA